MQNIEYIYQTLQSIDYNGGRYNIFLVKYPKYRVVMSLNMRDKVINHYFTRYVLMPKLTRFLDDRNVATRKEMGTQAGINYVKKFLDKNKKYDKFYILKTEDDKLAAICQTQGFKNFADVHYLERDKTKGYGLCGQAILASIAKHMLKQPDAYLKVDDPVKKARGFYINDCGFREETPGSHGIEMNEAELKTFVDNFEQKVEAPIVDIENE